MSLSQKSASDDDYKGNYVKDLNSSLVNRIIEIRKEIIDLLAILDGMEARASKNSLFRQSRH